MNKVTFIGIGGAGINIIKYVDGKLKDVEITNIFIDSTEKTIERHDSDKKNFHRLTNNLVFEDDVDGLAGERKNAQAMKLMMDSIKKIFDTLLLSKDRNHYIVPVFSASGGTGSTAGVMLVGLLLKHGYTLLPILIGDESTLLGLNNSINTIASLNGISKQNKKPLSLLYFSNTVDGNTSPATERDVNNKVLKTMNTVNVFISGLIRNIDNQDMINFFMPGNYNTFTVKPGLYNVGIGADTDELAIMARVIVDEDDADVKVTDKLTNIKIGVIEKDIKDRFSTYPMMLLLRRGIMASESKRLAMIKEEFEYLNNSNSGVINGCDDTTEDDFGMVF